MGRVVFSERIFRIDNIKALLIILVVLGHFLEIIPFENSNYLYEFIYIFHMPAFAFLSGVCYKKKSLKKLFAVYLYPYLVFQILYCLFCNYVLHQETIFQLSTPYWILWYLFAVFVWNVAAPLFVVDSVKKRIIIVAVLFALALIVGLDNNVGYLFSASRIIVLLPFFVFGMYFRKVFFNDAERNHNNAGKRMRVLLSGAGVAVIGIILYFIQSSVNPAWEYHSWSYEAQAYNMFVRGLILLGALVCICFICSIMPNRKIAVFSGIGKNSMAVFLVHGFIVKYLAYTGVLQLCDYACLLAIALSFIIAFVLSLKPVVFALGPLLRCPVIGRSR